MESREKWRQFRKAVVSKGAHRTLEAPVTATTKDPKDQAVRDSILVSLLCRTAIPVSLFTNF